MFECRRAASAHCAPYQEFIQSVDELLNVRNQTSALRNTALALNSSVQDVGAGVLGKVSLGTRKSN